MKQKLLLLFLLFLLPVVALAHSGGTDSKGGHYDRSTGQYHYHHGYSAHQHPNGVCPYERKETVTKGTTYSNSIISFPTATPRQIKIITARPTTTIIRASSITPRPSATAYLRPAVTVAPGGITTATPRATVKATATPRATAKATATPRVTASPTQRPTASTSTPMYVADDMSHVWNYLVLGATALISICVAIGTTHARKRDLQHAAADHNLQIEIARSEAKREARKESEKELQIAHAEISRLESKLNDANAEVDKLKERLAIALAPVPKPAPPKPVAKPETPGPSIDHIPRLAIHYISKYPKTWGYIKHNATNPDSYVYTYDHYWGKLQEYHGDGVIFDTLSDKEQELVKYKPLGDSVYISSVDSDTYHAIPDCYSLLKSKCLEIDAVHRIVLKRCTKCVAPPK